MTNQVDFVSDNKRVKTYTKEEIFDELKDILDKEIDSLLTYKNKLTKYQITMFVFYHEFVFFKAARYYWTVEKDLRGIKMQMSTDSDKIINKYNNNTRTSVPKKYREETKTSKTIKELIEYLYNLTDKEINNKDFSTTVYNYITSSGKIIKGWYWSNQVYLVRDNKIEKPYTKEEIFDELKDIFDEKIDSLLTYKNKLTKYQITQFVFFHEFVFLEAGGYYWTVEKDGVGIKVQMSTDRNKIIEKYGGKARTYDPIEYREKITTSKKIEELIDYLYDEELDNKYHYITSNCQRFSKRIYNFCK